MDDTLPAADSKFTDGIRLFRARASHLRSTAFVILSVIFALLVGGATVFVFAPQLTLADLYPQNIDKKIQDVRDERQKIQKQIDDADLAQLSPILNVLTKYDDPSLKGCLIMIGPLLEVLACLPTELFRRRRRQQKRHASDS
jgi:hypothetical protein